MLLLHADFFARNARAKTLCNLGLCSKILGDCDPNIFERLFACRTLAIATREVITPNSEALLGFHKRQVIGHYQKMQHLKNFLKAFVSTGGSLLVDI
jgi:hypothetical protein